MKWLLCLLLLSCWLAGPVRAQKPPVVTDTATLNFMRWYLKYSSSYDKKRFHLSRLTIRWQDAHFIPVGETTDFSSRLLVLYRTNNGLPTGFFNQVDLTAMRNQYEQETQMSWPELVSNFAFTSKNLYYKRGEYKPKRYRAFTLPLFSADKRKVIIWDYRRCGSHCFSAAVNVFERTATESWQHVKMIGGDME